MVLRNSGSIRIDGSVVFGERSTRFVPVRRNSQHAANQYETSISGYLSEIGRRATGHILLDELGRAAHGTSHRVNIAPYEIANGAAWGDIVDQTPLGEIVRDGRGAPILMTGDNPTTTRIERAGDVARGSGRGIDPNLLLDPRLMSPHTRGVAGFRPDEALFHELIHSKRQMQGRDNAIPMGDLFSNREEFIAILVTNIYSSEGGSRTLRRNWLGPNFSEIGAIDDFDPQVFSGLGAPRQPTAVERFVEKYHREINDFARSDAQFTRRLATVRANFNPIREHFMRIGAIPRS